jgi:hypothetical protein
MPNTPAGAAGDKLVRSPEEDLRWQVPAQFAAEGALNRDGLKWEFPDAGWNVGAASLAGDDEQPPLDDWESECHCRSIGEIKTKMFTARSALLASI